MKEDKEFWEAGKWQKNKATRHMGRGTHRVCAEAQRLCRRNGIDRTVGERHMSKEGMTAHRIPHLLSPGLSRNLLVLKYFLTQSFGLWNQITDQM